MEVELNQLMLLYWEAMIALSSLCTLAPIIAALIASNSVACILVAPEDKDAGW